MRVLLADGSRDVRTKVERHLLERRHVVVSAASGAEALFAIGEGAPQIIIADPSLPTADASTLLASVQSWCKGRGCPPPYFIALTRDGSKGETLTHLMGGADDVLFVPVDPSLLDARLKVAEWTLNPVDEEERESPDPLAVFTREHGHVLEVMFILDTVERDLEMGVPEDVLKWVASTALLLDFELHEEKEERYISIFIDKVLQSQGAQLGDLSQTVFTQITDEHRRIEAAVSALREGVEEFIAADRAALAEFEARVTNGDACQVAEGGAEGYVRHILESAGAHASKRREAVAKLRSLIRGYVDLLRPHLTMEEEGFFPLTQKYLDRDDNVRVMAEFSKIDARIGSDEVARHVEEVRRLAEAIRENPRAHAQGKP